MKNKSLIKNIEKLVDPIETGSMHVIQKYNQKLPVKVQHKIIANSSKENPYMGFIVEPYAHFLFFKIIDIDAAQALVHENFKIVKTRITADGDEDYYMSICSFNIRTSAFYGSRIEAYVIAENIETGLLSWVIVDVLTDTISYEQKRGLVGANAEVTVTTGFDGAVLVDARSDEIKLHYTSDISNGQKQKLDYRLWVEGNLSVGYGKKLSDNGDTFSLLFDTREVEYAQVIDAINIKSNNWFSNIVENDPSVVICFPYAQHFISDSPGSKTKITNADEMRELLANINFNQLKVYSSEGFFNAQMRFSLLMFVIIVVMFLIIIN